MKRCYKEEVVVSIQTSLGLMDLPLELLDMIRKELNETEQASFALICRETYAITNDTIKESISRYALTQFYELHHVQGIFEFIEPLYAKSLGSVYASLPLENGDEDFWSLNTIHDTYRLEIFDRFYKQSELVFRSVCYKHPNLLLCSKTYYPASRTFAFLVDSVRRCFININDRYYT